MAATERFVARGFGPGLPAEGASVSVRIVGENLSIEGWPEVSGIRKSQAQARRHGDDVVLEWAVADVMYALSFGCKSPLATWLPVGGRMDGVTRSWLWLALFVTVGLPLLVLAAFFAFRGQIIDAVVARIPVETEAKLADQLWQVQRVQLKLVEGTAANRFVDEVGARLVAARPTPYHYRFYLADDPSVNAFAMPAGYVVVNRGLLGKAATAEEVAGVLAHEIEHVEQRHSLRGMVQAVGLSAVWMIVSGDVVSGVTAEWLRDLVALQFSREQETAADAGGYQRLLAAKIDPRGMASFFDKLAQEQGDLPGALSMLSTHPASEVRAAKLKALLKDAPLLPPLNADWPAIRNAVSN